MRTSWAAVLAAVALAGCFNGASPDPDAGLPTEPVDLAPTFRAPVAIASITDLQGEFFLAVTPDGQTLLTCTHGAFTGPAPKYVSRDAGLTWTAIAPDLPTGVSGDCLVAIGDDGSWYFVDSQVGTNTVSSTSDEGATWTMNRFATPPITGTADRPYLLPLGGPSMGLTYVGQYLAPGTVAFTRTDDRGATWSTPVGVSQIEGRNTNIMHGAPVVDPTREVLRIPLLRFGAQDNPSGGAAPGDLRFAASRDGGATWTAEPVVDPVEALFAPPAVAWTQGLLYWAYQVPSGDQEDLMLVTSVDDGATWGEPRRIAGGWDYLGYMWMSGAPDGTAVLSFDADAAPLGNGDEGEHLILMRLDARQSDPLVWALAAAPATNAEFSTVTVDALGRLHASYRLDGQWLYLGEN